jgi:hypothetical protein
MSLDALCNALSSIPYPLGAADGGTHLRLAYAFLIGPRASARAEQGLVQPQLAGIGELAEVPGRSPSRGPPYCKSVVLRRKALGDAA